MSTSTAPSSGSPVVSSLAPSSLPSAVAPVESASSGAVPVGSASVASGSALEVLASPSAIGSDVPESSPHAEAVRSAQNRAGRAGRM